ncbi:MAG: 1-acyl-sn-glycerol-3-phosphate acyltransferase [Acidobacteria bacterium]|nr:1-acyl-sn-glycerol-3-phosphate acyltransferase [Acidobacteriota bacterium]
MRRSYRWLWIDPIIITFTGIMSCLSVFFSIFDGTGKLQHGCARTWARFIIRISKVSISVEGLDRIPLDRPCIFVSNHQSFFDIWTLLAELPVQFRFAAKESLFRAPFLGWHLRRSGNIPIHRGNPRKSLRSIREAGRKIDKGVSVLIFPEGERSVDGFVQPFKKGVFLLAAYSSAPIIPITIMGSRHCLPKNSIRIQPGDIRMVVSAPLETTDVTPRNIDNLVQKVYEAIVRNHVPEPHVSRA